MLKKIVKKNLEYHTVSNMYGKREYSLFRAVMHLTMPNGLTLVVTTIYIFQIRNW